MTKRHISKGQKETAALFCIIVIALILSGAYHCPFLWLTGVPCPGCQMTRALLALLKGQFTLSLTLHPLLIPTLICGLLAIVFWMKKWQKALRGLLIGWSVAMIVCWIWRLCFVFDLHIENGVYYHLFDLLF